MPWRLICAFLLAAAQAGAAQPPAPEAPAPDAFTDPARDARMAWWREARFGMFIHWGLYAIPAGQWNGKPAPGTGEWIQRNARIPANDYAALAASFNPTAFDARAWARLAKDAGMKYMVITSKHHDGFCLFKTDATGYDIIDATPFARDVIRELADACRDEGIRFGVYYSIWDWRHPDFKRDDAGLDRMPSYIDFMQRQLRELITNYQPAVLWFDGEWPPEWTEERGRDLYAFCRSLSPSVIINNRIGKARDDMAGFSKYRSVGDYHTPEQEIPGRPPPGADWETCMTLNDTWGYRSDDDNWKSSDTLIRHLAEVAGKGGNFLLNIGPRADGSIPQPSVDRLREVGAWLATNAQAIHGTSAGPFSNPHWGHATANGATLYLIITDWPADGRLELPGLRTAVLSARLLGGPAVALAPRQSGPWPALVLPADPPHPVASVVKLELEGPPIVEPVPFRPDADGAVDLPAARAELSGSGLRVERKADNIPNLGAWTGPEASASWLVDLPAGQYLVELELASTADSAGSRFLVELGPTSIDDFVPPTSGWGNFVMHQAGLVRVDVPGRYTLRVRPGGDLKHALMNLRRVRLTPAP